MYFALPHCCSNDPLLFRIPSKLPTTTLHHSCLRPTVINTKLAHLPGLRFWPFSKSAIRNHLGENLITPISLRPTSYHIVLGCTSTTFTQSCRFCGLRRIRMVKEGIPRDLQRPDRKDCLHEPRLDSTVMMRTTLFGL